jgi:isoquinoline 1-oxidoreductase beta subunit
MANHPKHLAVLNAAAERAGWGTPRPRASTAASPRPWASGATSRLRRGVGEPRGQAQDPPHRGATDPGHAVNPQQIDAQVAGSFVYGLTALLYGECTVAGGRMEQENFDTYNVMRIDEMPPVETVLVPSGGFWGGVGEPTIAVAAPAVLNAIFAATGKRVRTLPLKDADLRAA